MLRIMNNVKVNPLPVTVTVDSNQFNGNETVTVSSQCTVQYCTVNL